MARSLRSSLTLIFAALLLAACGGGGGGDGGGTSSASSASISTLEPSAPAATGNTAVDGFNWFNFRRTQIGLPAVAQNSTVNIAAQGHSDYQKIWGIDHYQVEGRTGFTGVCVYDNAADPLCPPAKVSRLEAANYHLPATNYAFGEVISATSNPSGADAAEGLVSAIYHRFVILEPMFKEAGVGAAVGSNGVTYFTTNFVTNGLDTAYSLCTQKNPPLVTYPFDGQQRVQRNFSSDSEVPDPVPGQDVVGYPISVHADITASISTQSFTVRPRGGSPLPVRTLTNALDPDHTPATAAAIVPTSVLEPGTTYDVQFSGTVNCPLLSRSVNLTWSFTTR